MLKGIPAVITPPLLQVMAEMGHDESILFADANFTSQRVAQAGSSSHPKPVLYLPLPILDILPGVLQLFPLVADEKHPIAYMQAGGINGPSALQRQVLALVKPLLLPEQSAEAIERYAFYTRAANCYAIVKTAEPQPYGNFILRKGVIATPLQP